jgi:hypothetical protein
MSEENVQVIRAAIEAINADDVDAVLARAAPGFEYSLRKLVPPRSSLSQSAKSDSVGEAKGSVVSRNTSP